ncbi:hypothetical protein KQX54_005234 [Cotesia glomerata]|uniref:C2H2-type domain-containing protein n=2 Tax=Cotesia glomerata TaxID=32391 RepID=A0AAV7I7E7_COTGL|nr:hypothetical protein KQX54_005234 [Cotesia glomerata]
MFASSGLDSRCWCSAYSRKDLATTSLNPSIGLMSLPVENGPSVQVPRSLMQAFLKQDPNHPGLETVRLPNPLVGNEEPCTLPSYCREIESEVCLVCRRCGRAYPQESSLLTHQRSCYLGNQQRRGALRLVQARFSCSLCDTAASTRTYGTLGEWRRHAETVQHRARLESLQIQQRTSGSSNFGQFSSPDFNLGLNLGQDANDEEANPLVDEMEDVVNQITLLAARAAAESTSTSTQSAVVSQDNNNGEAKRQKLVQEVAALAGAR